MRIAVADLPCGHYPLLARLTVMVIHFSGFTLDDGRRQLFREATVVHLTPKAYELLLLLVSHAPRVVAKRELHDRLWPGTFVSDATLTGLVKELRRALDDRSPASPIIRTAHRVGYAFCPAVEPTVVGNGAPMHWLVMRGRRVPLREGEHVIGRDTASDVCLDDVSVSRTHARLLIDGATVRLEDLGSKNGTTVAGEAVRGQVVLRNDDRVAFGSVLAVYRSSQSAMSTETQTRSHLKNTRS